MFELGQKVRFTYAPECQGIVVAQTSYLHQLPRFAVQPLQPKDGRPAEWEWCSELELQALDEAVEPKAAESSSATPPRPSFVILTHIDPAIGSHLGDGFENFINRGQR